MFEPEKIERFETGCDECSESVAANGEWVRASDYDQLLALYRDLQRSFVVGQNQSILGEVERIYPPKQ